MSDQHERMQECWTGEMLQEDATLSSSAFTLKYLDLEIILLGSSTAEDQMGMEKQ
jgi:hypothetical protein